MEEIVETEIRYVADLTFLKVPFRLVTVQLTLSPLEVSRSPITDGRDQPRNYTQTVSLFKDARGSHLGHSLSRTVQDIFLHFESILAVNQELKTQLETRLSHWDSGLDQVGDIFLALVRHNRIAHSG